MSQYEAPLGGNRKNAIRATRQQLSILKTAFAASDVVSRGALQDIAAQTGLPPKWINNWFGRERSKLRNSLGKGLPTSAVALSPAEIVSVKSEFGDPRSSPFSDASGFDKSNEITAPLPKSASSSGLKTVFSFVPARAMTLENTSQLQHLGVVVEAPRSTTNLHSEDLRDAPPPKEDQRHPITHVSAKSWNEHHFSMNIAPPKRSPMQSTARGVNQPTQRRLSNLVNDFSGSIYSSFSPAGDSSSSGVDSGHKATWRLPGSGLRSVANGEMENAPLVPCAQTFDFAPALVGPAFPWTADLHISQGGLANTLNLPSIQNVAQVSSSAGAPAHSTSLAPPAEARFIDPTKAPLKHLTELLLDFKDENGCYSRLLVVEEDAKLRKILLEDISVEEDPFLAAMALSLLAGLGFKWE